MSPVPTGDAETSSVLALTVQFAPGGDRDQDDQDCEDIQDCEDDQDSGGAFTALTVQLAPVGRHQGEPHDKDTLG